MHTSPTKFSEAALFLRSAVERLIETERIYSSQNVWYFIQFLKTSYVYAHTLSSNIDSFCENDIRSRQEIHKRW